MEVSAPLHPPLVVLDTQAVLDWRYFCDVACAAWKPPGADWQWIATPAMRDELAQVLARGFRGTWESEPAAVLAFFDRHASVWPERPGSAAPAGLRCTDPDDQKFIDLAVGARAAWLISRDRAVLKLRRRALSYGGVRIVRPVDWQPTG